MVSGRQSADGQLGNLSHYELNEVVGVGGMGTVYRATDLRSGTTVAVKLIHEHLQLDPSYLERFRREAHVASLLHSPYTVRLLDFGYDRGRYFMVSEFVEGVTLKQLIGLGPVAPLEALAIAAQVALALDEAWWHGVVHRDIKPENIIITRDRSVKVMDFGIARLSYTAGFTAPGMFVGTIAYAAPEQFRGEGDARSDMYSLGVTLFQMLAGELPFQAESISVLMRMHEEMPAPLEKLRHVPQAVSEVVARCLEKDPSNRYQRPSDFLAAVENARQSLVVPQTDTWLADATATLAATRLEPLPPPPPHPEAHHPTPAGGTPRPHMATPPPTPSPEPQPPRPPAYTPTPPPTPQPSPRPTPQPSWTPAPPTPSPEPQPSWTPPPAPVPAAMAAPEPGPDRSPTQPQTGRRSQEWQSLMFALAIVVGAIVVGLVVGFAIVAFR